MGIYKFIQSSDILGVNASLFTDKNYSSHKNFFGGFLSISVFLLIFSGSIFFLKEFFKREQLNLIAGFVDDLKIINKNFNDMSLMFRVSGDRGSLYPEGYYFIKAEFNEYDASISSTQKVTYLKIEKCSLSKNFKDREAMFDVYKDTASDFYCINWEDIKFDLTGSYGKSSKFSYMAIYFFNCHHEENPNPETCADKDLVDVGLMESYVDLVTVSNSIDHYSTVPNTEILYKARIPVSNSVFKRIWLSFQAVEYTTDFGLIFESLSEDFFFKIKGYTIDLDLRVGYPFVYLTIVNDVEKLTFIKTYMKAPTLLANIGGIIKGLTLIGTVLNYSISKNLNNLEIINTLYTNESLLKIYKIDRMVSKTSLKKLQTYSNNPNSNFDGRVNELNDKFKLNNNGNSAQYNNLKQESIRDGDSLNRIDKISIDDINKNLMAQNNLGSINRKMNDDTTQKGLVNMNNNQNNFQALNENQKINSKIKIKDASKQKHIVNNYVKDNKNINDSSNKDSGSENNKNFNRDNSIFNNEGQLNVSNAKASTYNNISKKEITYANIIRKKFTLSYLQHLDPILICLNSSDKKKHLNVLHKAHEYLNHRNLIKTFQEYSYLKRIILDEHQNSILDNIFNVSDDNNQDIRLNKSINDLALKREKSFIDSKILNVFDFVK